MKKQKPTQAERIKKRHEECKQLLDEIEAKLGYRPVNSDMTLEEIAKFFGVTRERIRQIEDRAIKKMKHPHIGRLLRAYRMD